MSKLRRFRRNLDNSEVDRSESHYRRWEACRNKRDAYITEINAKHKKNKRNNSKGRKIDSREKNIHETTSGNEEELAEEEKDSFHSFHSEQNTDDKQVFGDLNSKLSKVFGRCVDDHDVSPPMWGHQNNFNQSNSPSPHDDRPEADKARVGFRPLLSKKSRQLKVCKVD